jgi:hypothetical protein
VENWNTPYFISLTSPWILVEWSPTCRIRPGPVLPRIGNQANRRRWRTLTFSALVGLGSGSAAADGPAVDAATRQVERGAHQIGQSQVLVDAAAFGSGIRDFFVDLFGG